MEKALALVSGLCAALAFLLGWLLRGGPGGKAAAIGGTNHEEVKDEVEREIENARASDLVDAAPDAGELRSDAAAIAGKFRERLRDRIRRILSGSRSGGADGSG
jgi:hypothetical protein